MMIIQIKIMKRKLCDYFTIENVYPESSTRIKNRAAPLESEVTSHEILLAGRRELLSARTANVEFGCVPSTRIS
jgi:hypothetical protein